MATDNVYCRIQVPQEQLKRMGHHSQPFMPSHVPLGMPPEQTIWEQNLRRDMLNQLIMELGLTMELSGPKGNGLVFRLYHDKAKKDMLGLVHIPHEDQRWDRGELNHHISVDLNPCQCEEHPDGDIYFYIVFASHRSFMYNSGCCGWAKTPAEAFAEAERRWAEWGKD